MSKQEFLTQLRKELSGLSRKDVEERLTFYSEMIEDRMDEGLSEEDAVSAVGAVEEIVAQAVADIPPAKWENEDEKPKRRFKTWEILLLALGCPIWLSLAVTAVAVAISLFASICAVIVSFWAVFASLIVSAFCGIGVGIVFFCKGNVLTGIATFAAVFICAGFSVFTFYGCKAVTKGIAVLTKKCFKKKEEA